jgi:tetratricopeptide (TPR) repeat protein
MMGGSQGIPIVHAWGKSAVTDEERLEELLDLWEETREDGSRPIPEEFCRDCPELLEEFRRRLRLLARVDDFLQDSTRLLSTVRPGRGERQTSGDNSPGGSSLSDDEASLPVVAGYEVLGVLGRGGMGVVYKARQLGLDRLIALKMIRTGEHADRDEAARFQAEAQAVARLRHAHIVAIHEVGQAGGQPFFSLELVEGGSLRQQLAGAALPPPQAARLVQTLARAVQAAHEAGIVHRDLKPANVLLTADGTPKIADFGLAKFLGSDSGRTQSGAILGTPSYMAPEQAQGESRGGGVGPAADVWALGAILYECLTGRPPFRGPSVLETLEQVRSQEPVPPCRLQPKTPRDLETITLKCLQKEPARRYGSAGDLAADLGRFLAGEPIRARPVGTLERLRKWARRKPALASLLGVSGLLLIALVVGGLVYQLRLQAALGRAEAKEVEARRQQQRFADNYQRANATLDRVLNRMARWPVGAVPRLKELQREQLEEALAFYQGSLQEDDGSDPSMRANAAWARARMADIQQRLGQRREAAENYRRAVELFESLPAEQRDAADTRGKLQACYVNWSWLPGSFAEVEQRRRIALDIAERLGRAEPNEPRWQSRIAQGEDNLGSLYQSGGRAAEAEPHYLRAENIRTALVRDHPAEEVYRAELAQTCINLAVLYQGTKRAAAAIASYERAEGLLRPLIERHPPGGDYALSLASVYVNWSYLPPPKGGTAAVLAQLDRAVGLVEGVVQAEPQYADARDRAFRVHARRAEFYKGSGRWAEAAADYGRALELHDGPERWKLAVWRAEVLAEAGDHARAAAAASQALEQNPEMPTDGLVNLAGVCARASGLARADARLPVAERAALAERYAARAVALLQKVADKGYFRDLDKWLALKTEPALEPLHGRADFQKLLRDTFPNPLRGRFGKPTPNKR